MAPTELLGGRKSSSGFLVFKSDSNSNESSCSSPLGSIDGIHRFMNVGNLPLKFSTAPIHRANTDSKLLEKIKKRTRHNSKSFKPQKTRSSLSRSTIDSMRISGFSPFPDERYDVSKRFVGKLMSQKMQIFNANYLTNLKSYFMKLNASMNCDNSECTSNQRRLYHHYKKCHPEQLAKLAPALTDLCPVLSGRMRAHTNLYHKGEEPMYARALDPDIAKRQSVSQALTLQEQLIKEQKILEQQRSEQQRREQEILKQQRLERQQLERERQKLEQQRWELEKEKREQQRMMEERMNKEKRQSVLGTSSEPRKSFQDHKVSHLRLIENAVRTWLIKVPFSEGSEQSREPFIQTLIRDIVVLEDENDDLETKKMKLKRTIYEFLDNFDLILPKKMDKVTFNEELCDNLYNQIKVISDFARNHANIGASTESSSGESIRINIRKLSSYQDETDPRTSKTPKRSFQDLQIPYPKLIEGVVKSWLLNVLYPPDTETSIEPFINTFIQDIITVEDKNYDPKTNELELKRIIHNFFETIGALNLKTNKNTFSEEPRYHLYKQIKSISNFVRHRYVIDSNRGENQNEPEIQQFGRRKSALKNPSSDPSRKSITIQTEQVMGRKISYPQEPRTTSEREKMIQSVIDKIEQPDNSEDIKVRKNSRKLSFADWLKNRRLSIYISGRDSLLNDLYNTDMEPKLRTANVRYALENKFANLGVNNARHTPVEKDLFQKYNSQFRTNKNYERYFQGKNFSISKNQQHDDFHLGIKKTSSNSRKSRRGKKRLNYKIKGIEFEEDKQNKNESLDVGPLDVHISRVRVNRIRNRIGFDENNSFHQNIDTFSKSPERNHRQPEPGVNIFTDGNRRESTMISLDADSSNSLIIDSYISPEEVNIRRSSKHSNYPNNETPIKRLNDINPVPRKKSLSSKNFVGNRKMSNRRLSYEYNVPRLSNLDNRKNCYYETGLQNNLRTYSPEYGRARKCSRKNRRATQYSAESRRINQCSHDNCRIIEYSPEDHCRNTINSFYGSDPKSSFDKHCISHENLIQMKPRKENPTLEKGNYKRIEQFENEEEEIEERSNFTNQLDNDYLPDHFIYESTDESDPYGSIGDAVKEQTCSSLSDIAPKCNDSPLDDREDLKYYTIKHTCSLKSKGFGNTSFINHRNTKVHTVCGKPLSICTWKSKKPTKKNEYCGALSAKDIKTEMTKCFKDFNIIQDHEALNTIKAIDVLTEHLQHELTGPELSVQNLKCKFVFLLKDLNIFSDAHRQMKLNIHLLAEDLAIRLIRIYKRLESYGSQNWKCSLRRHKLFENMDYVKIGSKEILRSDLKHDLMLEIEDCLYYTKIGGNRHLREQITEKLISNIELIHKGFTEKVFNEIKAILERTGLLADFEMYDIVERAMTSAKEIVSYINDNQSLNTNGVTRSMRNNYTVSVFLSESETNPSFSGTRCITTNKVRAEKSNSINKLAAIIKDWLAKAPSDFKYVRDERFINLTTQELAINITNYMKFRQLTAKTNTIDLERLIMYHVSKWMLRLNITNNIQKAEPYTRVLARKIAKISALDKNNASCGERQTNKTLERSHLIKEISTWLGKQSPDMYQDADENDRKRIVNELTDKIKPKLDYCTEIEITRDVRHWMKKVINSRKRKRINNLSKNLMKKIINLSHSEQYIQAEPEKIQRNSFTLYPAEAENSIRKNVYKNFIVQNYSDIMQHLIISFIENVFETDDLLTKRGYLMALKAELQKLNSFMRRQVLGKDSAVEHYDKFSDAKFNNELIYVQDISDWLTEIPIDSYYNSTRNKDRVDFIMNLAEIIAKTENESQTDPKTQMEYNERLISIIAEFISLLPVKFVQNIDYTALVILLVTKIISRRNEIACEVPKRVRDFSDFVGEYIKINGQDVVGDSLRLEAWAFCVNKEIQKLLTENYAVDELKNLNSIQMPGEEMMEIFQLKLDFINQINRCMRNLPLKENVSFEMPYNLALQMTEYVLERIQLEDLVRYIENWISELPLDCRQDTKIELVIHQLLNTMENIKGQYRVEQIRRLSFESSVVETNGHINQSQPYQDHSPQNQRTDTVLPNEQTSASTSTRARLLMKNVMDDNNKKAGKSGQSKDVGGRTQKRVSQSQESGMGAGSGNPGSKQSDNITVASIGVLKNTDIPTNDRSIKQNPSSALFGYTQSSVNSLFRPEYSGTKQKMQFTNRGISSQNVINTYAQIDSMQNSDNNMNNNIQPKRNVERKESNNIESTDSVARRQSTNIPYPDPRRYIEDARCDADERRTSRNVEGIDARYGKQSKNFDLGGGRQIKDLQISETGDRRPSRIPESVKSGSRRPSRGWRQNKDMKNFDTGNRRPSRNPANDKLESRRPSETVKSSDSEVGSQSRDIQSFVTSDKRSSKNIESVELGSTRPSRDVQSTDTRGGRQSKDKQSFDTGSRRPSRNVESDESGSRRPSRNVESYESGSKRPSRNVESDESGSRRPSRNVESDELGFRRPSRNVESDESGSRRPSRNVENDESGSRRLSRNVESSVSGSKRPSTNIEGLESGSRRPSKNIQSTETAERRSIRSIENVELDSRRPSRNIKDVDAGSRRLSRNIQTTDTAERRSIRSMESVESRSKRPSGIVESVDTGSRRTSINVEGLESGIRNIPITDTGERKSIKSLENVESGSKRPSKTIPSADTAERQSIRSVGSFASGSRRPDKTIQSTEPGDRRRSKSAEAAEAGSRRPSRNILSPVSGGRRQSTTSTNRDRQSQDIKKTEDVNKLSWPALSQKFNPIVDPIPIANTKEERRISTILLKDANTDNMRRPSVRISGQVEHRIISDPYLHENYLESLHNLHETQPESDKKYSSRKPGDMIVGVVEEWSQRIPLPITVPQQAQKAIRHGLVTKVLIKISELNDRTKGINDDTVYNRLLDKDLDNILENIPESEELAQKRNLLKQQLESFIKSMKPFITEEQAGYAYTRNVEDNLTNAMFSQPEKVDENVMKNIKDDIVINLIKYVCEPIELYKNNIREAVSRYFTQIMQHKLNDRELENQHENLMDVLTKIPRPGPSTLKNILGQLDMHQEVKKFLSTIPVKERRNSLENTLAKELYDMESMGYDDRNINKMRFTIKRYLLNYNVPVVDDKKIMEFLNTLKETADTRAPLEEQDHKVDEILKQWRKQGQPPNKQSEQVTAEPPEIPNMNDNNLYTAGNSQNTPNDRFQIDDIQNTQGAQLPTYWNKAGNTQLAGASPSCFNPSDPSCLNPSNPSCLNPSYLSYWNPSYPSCLNPSYPPFMDLSKPDKTESFVRTQETEKATLCSCDPGNSAYKKDPNNNVFPSHWTAKSDKNRKKQEKGTIESCHCDDDDIENYEQAAKANGFISRGSKTTDKNRKKSCLCDTKLDSKLFDFGYKPCKKLKRQDSKKDDFSTRLDKSSQGRRRPFSPTSTNDCCCKDNGFPPPCQSHNNMITEYMDKYRPPESVREKLTIQQGPCENAKCLCCVCKGRSGAELPPAKGQCCRLITLGQKANQGVGITGRSQNANPQNAEAVAGPSGYRISQGEQNYFGLGTNQTQTNNPTISNLGPGDKSYLPIITPCERSCINNPGRGENLDSPLNDSITLTVRRHSNFPAQPSLSTLPSSCLIDVAPRYSSSVNGNANLSGAKRPNCVKRHRSDVACGGCNAVPQTGPRSKKQKRDGLSSDNGSSGQESLSQIYFESSETRKQLWWM